MKKQGKSKDRNVCLQQRSQPASKTSAKPVIDKDEAITLGGLPSFVPHPAAHVRPK